MHQIIEFFHNLFHPEQLQLMMQQWGWVGYIILFAIVFAETGLLVGFCLPGDSLLFIAGFVCTIKGVGMQWQILMPLLMCSAVIGDTVNYFLGYKTGPIVYNRPDSRFFKRKHLMAAHDFYEKHGGAAIIYARFVPIVRTFAPFVAGVAGMNYSRFIRFNIIGGMAWVASMMLLGFFLGKVSWVQHNLEKAVLLVIFISILPLIIEYVKEYRRSKARRAAGILAEETSPAESSDPSAR